MTTLASTLALAARQGRSSPWTLRTTKRRIKVRFPKPFLRGVMLVEPWSKIDGLEGSARA